MQVLAVGSWPVCTKEVREGGYKQTSIGSAAPLSSLSPVYAHVASAQTFPVTVSLVPNMAIYYIIGQF